MWIEVITMIRRYYHIRVEVRPEFKQDQLNRGEKVVATCTVHLVSWFQDPEFARQHAWEKVVSEFDFLTMDNSMPMSFARC